MENLTFWRVHIPHIEFGTWHVLAYSREHAIQVWSCIAPMVYLNHKESTTYHDTEQDCSDTPYALNTAILALASGWRRWNDHHDGALESI